MFRIGLAAALAGLLVGVPLSGFAAPYAVFSVKRESMFVLYTDTVDEVGPYSRAWIGIFSPRSKDPDSLPVIKVMFEWDCAQKRHRQLSSIGFNESMTTAGQENDVEAWAYLPPGSIYDRMLRYICDRDRSGLTVRDDTDERILANYRAALTTMKD